MEGQRRPANVETDEGRLSGGEQGVRCCESRGGEASRLDRWNVIVGSAVRETPPQARREGVEGREQEAFFPASGVSKMKAGLA
jgi:hypothetical protein